MKSRSHKNSRPGMVLLAVLFIVMAISLVSLGFTIRSDTELACGENFSVHTQTDYLAKSALTHAKAVLANPWDVETGGAEYWPGDTGLQIEEGSSSYYDLTVTRADSGPTQRCTYDIQALAYRTKNSQKISQSTLNAQLRFDKCIALWMGVAETASKVIYEAEDGSLSGTALSTGFPGYSGSGYVTGFDLPGSEVTVTVNVPVTRNYPLTIRYRSEFGDKNNQIVVNGGFVSTATFIQTAEWSDLDFGGIGLNAGDNTITVRALAVEEEGNGGIEIDYLELEVLAAPVVINGDVYCNDNLVSSGTINGDVFAPSFMGAATGQVYPTSEVEVTWPDLRIENFAPTYYIDSDPYLAEILTGGTYSEAVDEPSSGNPMGVFYHNGNLTLTGNMNISGTLVVNGDLYVEGENNVFSSVKNFPAIIVAGRLEVRNGGELTVNGLVQIQDRLRVLSNAADITMIGGLLIKDYGLDIDGAYSGTIGLTADPMKGALKVAYADHTSKRWSSAGRTFFQSIER